MIVLAFRGAQYEKDVIAPKQVKGTLETFRKFLFLQRAKSLQALEQHIERERGG